MDINQLKYIKLQADIKLLPSKSLQKESQNYFRIFKQEKEDLSDDSFYSPYFGNGTILTLGNHYGDRINAMTAILNNLSDNYYISVYLTYDFRFTVPDIEYTTKNAFGEIKQLIENSLYGTKLYLAFMVSHFNQFIGKSNKLKPEHYHILISFYDKNTDIVKAMQDIKNRMLKHSIIGKINVSI